MRIVLLSFLIFIEKIHPMLFLSERPLKEIKHHYDVILIQCYFNSVNEPDVLFITNFKAISVKLSKIFKNITFYWSQNTVGYLFHCFSQRLA